jgi:hypothetical protein
MESRKVTIVRGGGARRLIWIAIVSASSILFSYGMACATPLAAIAAVCALTLPRKDAILLVAFAWLSNQAVGYLILDYPRSWDSYAWGLAIGIAAFGSLFTSIAVRRLEWAFPARLTAAFLLAFAAYEIVLYAATAVLPSGDDAFSTAIVLKILEMNAIALVGLAVLHRSAEAIGFLPPGTSRRVSLTFG